MTVRETMESLDFEFTHTGGGATGWRFDLADGSHVIVTHDSSADADPVSPYWCAGLFDAGGGHIADTSDMRLDALLNWLSLNWIK